MGLVARRGVYDHDRRGFRLEPVPERDMSLRARDCEAAYDTLRAVVIAARACCEVPRRDCARGMREHETVRFERERRARAMPRDQEVVLPQSLERRDHGAERILRDL